MIRLYYSPGSCSLASHIALEEAGLPFEAIPVSFADGEQGGPAYKAINPKGRVPALVQDGWTLTESPAILAYIAQASPEAGLWPTEAKGAARAAEWMAWLSSTIHPAYSHVIRPERYIRESVQDELVACARETCRTLWAEVDGYVGAGPWALGDSYSVVDPYLLVIWTWGRSSLDFDVVTACPNWTAHARRMWDRPAVRVAFGREGLSFPD